jgi:hypothetical protein
MLLEERQQDDEEVAAAHLVERKLRLAGRAVRPRDRHDRERMAAYDRLQGQLDGQVEVRRHERLHGLDDLTAVGLERVGRVVVAVAE